MSDNIKLTADEIRQIRTLEDFDLTMFLSELNDHGWKHARVLLGDIAMANAAIHKLEPTKAN